MTLPLELSSENDESERPSSGMSGSIGEVGEKFGDWGLKISEIRSNGLKPLRPEEPGGFRRRPDRGVENPDNPLGMGAPVCRRRLPDHGFLDCGSGAGVPNCDVGRGVSVGLVDAAPEGGVIRSCGIRGEMGLGTGTGTDCCCGLLGKLPVGLDGVFLDLRRDGVKNNRLFRSFLVVSPSFRLCEGVGEGLAWWISSCTISLVVVLDRPCPLVVFVKGESGVEGVVLSVEGLLVSGDRLRVGLSATNGCSEPPSDSIAGFLAGMSVISIPSGEPKP